MPNLLSSAEVDVGFDRHRVQVTDEEAEEALPLPYGHISVGTSAVLFRSLEDIWQAQFVFESWDGEPGSPDESEWPDIQVVSLYLPSGHLAVDQFTRGAVSDVFDARGSGHFRVRVAWRELRWRPDTDLVDPQAFALLQFWPATG